MPFSDTAVDAALAALWGDGHGSGMPATFEVGLLTDDPRVSGVEVSGPGYARVSGSNTTATLGTPSGGVQESTGFVFADPTGEWSTGRFWGRWVSGALFDFGRLDSPIAVSGAGPGPVVVIRARFNERLI